MNPFGKYKILSHYAAARSILDGHIPPPRMVSFWPTTICNYNCSFFLDKKEHKENHVVADTKNTIKMIDDIASMGVKSLEFSGGGEPTMHPQFEEIAEHAYNKELKLGLFTNGTNFHYDILKDFRYVRIGLDAADSDMYCRTKGVHPELFGVACDNVKKFVREQMGSQRPRVGVKFLIHPGNQKHIKEYRNVVS